MPAASAEQMPCATTPASNTANSDPISEHTKYSAKATEIPKTKERRCAVGVALDPRLMSSCQVCVLCAQAHSRKYMG